MKRKLNISVVIPCYNSNNTIERALDSIKNQTMLPVEVILVDDCGKEDLKSLIDSIVDKYSDSFNLKVITAEQNGGAGTARNLGWNAAIGEYIAFLDSDDSWLPSKLENQIEYFENDSKLTLLGSNHYVETEQNTMVEENLVKTDADVKNIDTFNQLIKNRFATSTVMLKKDIPFRFKNQKRYSEDFLLWNQIVLSGMKSIVINTYTCIYHKPMYGSSGLSSHMSKMIKGELETYQILYNERYYSLLKLNLLLIYSYMKYIRRLIKVKLS